MYFFQRVANVWMHYSLFGIISNFVAIKCRMMKELDLQYPTCPIRNVISRISDKWSLLILVNLQAQPVMRYKDIMAAIPDISQKMLSSTLRKLEEDHLISRKMYPEIPPRVEYSLTDMGKELMPAVQLMITWAQAHFNEITS